MTSWGVDSAGATNTGLYDSIKQKAGQAPSFWGRYIGGLYALSVSEANYLHSKSCHILVLYNGATPSSVSGGYASGQNDAHNAINAANAIGVSNGTAIYVDIEASWSPSQAWIQGWADTMNSSRFNFGFYADTLLSAFNSPYCNAINADHTVTVGFVYASEPEPGCTSAGSAPGYNPARPPCNSSATHLWQYAEGCYGGTADEDEADSTGGLFFW